MITAPASAKAAVLLLVLTAILALLGFEGVARVTAIASVGAALWTIGRMLMRARSLSTIR